MITLATVPLVAVEATSSYAWLALVLLVRGIGMGCSMMPKMASAYAVLPRDEAPAATSVLNTLQRLGGSIGTALLAVVLSDQAGTALGSAAASAGGQKVLPKALAVVRRPGRGRPAKGVWIQIPKFLTPWRRPLGPGSDTPQAQPQRPYVRTTGRRCV